MGRTVRTPYNSRDIPAHLNGKNVIQCTSPTIRTAPPKMWQTLSACSHPCRVVYLVTSPHPSNGKERRSAGTAGSNNKNYKNYPHGFPTSFSQRKANARSVALKRKSCLSVAKSPFKWEQSQTCLNYAERRTFAVGNSFSLAERRKRVAEKMQSWFFLFGTFSFVSRQKQCKSNAIKFTWIAEMQPVLWKRKKYINKTKFYL